MNWLSRFMMGRYGADQLSFALLALGLLCSMLSRVPALRFFFFLSYAIMAVMLFRMLSRNPVKRRIENEKFLKIWNPVAAWGKLQMQIFRERKVYRYFRCPKCKSYVRIPRGKGKVKISCRMCRHEFLKKT
ncbi:MAG: hypothetical protein E7409_01380 [Ruminococcaceae bacterium]|nr:hypothetical protein [Oscillospiraceae bacterium]